MKFQPNSFNSVQLTERTKNAFSYVTRGIILKINMQEENDRRNYFLINLHESIVPGRD